MSNAGFGPRRSGGRRGRGDSWRLQGAQRGIPNSHQPLLSYTRPLRNSFGDYALDTDWEGPYHARMDPTDFWPRLSEMLETHHGRRGVRLGAKAALAIAWSLIILPWAMATTAIAAVLYAVVSLFDGELVPQLRFPVLSALLVMPIIWGSVYVAARLIYAKKFKELARWEQTLQDHWRKHNETPAWHFVLRTPEEALENREHIKSIIRRYFDEVREEEMKND